MFNWRRMLTNFAMRLIARRKFTLETTADGVRGMMARFDKPYEPPSDIQYRKETLVGIDCEWLQPDGVADDAPLILHFPGGGWFLPAMGGHRDYLVDMCRANGCRAILAQYRLAPEYMMPVGQIDGFNIYRYLLEELKQNPEKLFISGDSAGGNVGLSALLQARDNKLPMPAGGMFLSPGSDLTMSGDSTLENMDKDPMFHISALHWMVRNAVPVKIATNDPLISPGLGDFTGLPPLLFEAGSTELLRDHSTVAAMNAEKAGVDVEFHISPKSPHVYPLMNYLPEGSAARERMGKFMARLLAPAS